MSCVPEDCIENIFSHVPYDDLMEVCRSIMSEPSLFIPIVRMITKNSFWYRRLSLTHKIHHSDRWHSIYLNLIVHQRSFALLCMDGFTEECLILLDNGYDPSVKKNEAIRY